MTERFSPEYISYILSDEAKVLQGQWKKRGVRKGDWAWDAGTEAGRARLVTSTETHTWLLDFLLDGIARRWTAEVDWLPTLSDLLGMIEEAGWKWYAWPNRINETEWEGYAVGASRGGRSESSFLRDHIEIVELSKELAAATLAVRVLEEKEQPR